MALPLEKQWTYADVLAWDEGGGWSPTSPWCATRTSWTTRVARARR